ncbi:MAG: spore cortex biosynthesis protein YabQ [Clostridia bacterium]|nr:spore cortex biosynthesis protein YabQ [Clostridia bacterium]
MGISITGQGLAFLMSLPLGAVMAFLYGILRICRYISVRKVNTDLCDFVCLFLFFMLYFAFQLYASDGELRLHLLSGCVGGFYLWRVLIGETAERFIIRFVRRIRSIFIKIRSFALLHFQRLWGIINKSFFVLKIKEFLQKGSRGNGQAKSEKEEDRDSAEARSPRGFRLYSCRSDQHVRKDRRCKGRSGSSAAAGRPAEAAE